MQHKVQNNLIQFGALAFNNISFTVSVWTLALALMFMLVLVAS